MSERIEGKIIVVTGASSGIGRAAAMQLARLGAQLCLVARRADELEQVRAEIEAEGGTAWIYPADLAVESAVEACGRAILAQHGAVDVLINNAGRSIRRSVRASFERYHDFQRTMQLNYFAAVKLTLQLLPGMLERRSGQIINVSSMSVLGPTPNFAAYVASKSALEGFSRSLAAEMVDRGVQVTVVNFPLVKTAMTAPTQLYKHVRQMDAEKAGAWIVNAVRKRPYRVANSAGAAWSMATTAMPGSSANWSGRLARISGKLLQRLADAQAPADEIPDDGKRGK